MKMFYFGCRGDVGHYMHGEDKQKDHDFFKSNPWGTKIDGGLCPPGDQTQGVALNHHKDGWTALAFWDRSVDSRPNSNSVFIAEDFYLFDEMLRTARKKFPWVFDRLDFKITDFWEG